MKRTLLLILLLLCGIAKGQSAVVHTSGDYYITNEQNETLFVNTNAVTFHLPVTPPIGNTYKFFVGESGDFTIVGGHDKSIDPIWHFQGFIADSPFDEQGMFYGNGSVGLSTTLIYRGGNRWAIVSVTGSWTGLP